MMAFKQYRNKKNPQEIVEAKRVIESDGSIEYCVYREKAGDNFWGEDYPEEYFLANFEEISDVKTK